MQFLVRNNPWFKTDIYFCMPFRQRQGDRMKKGRAPQNLFIHSFRQTLTESVHGTETVPHLAIKHTGLELFNTAQTCIS